jgi:hypothetical protein
MFRTSLFKRFDPLTGEVPEYLSDVTDRARFILRGRQRTEIRFAHKTILWMMARVDAAKFEAQKNLKPKKRKKAGDKEWSRYSPAFDLLSFVEQPELAGKRNLRKMPWHQYFALLALALIAKHTLDLAEEKRVRKRLLKSSAPINTDDDRNHAIELIAEAITIAEMLERWPKLSEIIESKGKDKTQKQKAEKRWDLNTKLRARVENWYIEIKREKPRISVPETADKIYEAHREEIDAVLKPAAAVDTLVDWIRWFNNFGPFSAR